MRKLIGIVLFVAIIFISANVYAAETFDISLTKNIDESTENKVILYIELTKYSGDGLLGYEGILEYDNTVFENVVVESMNNWDRASYDATTGKIVSTTDDAKSNTKIAKITLEIKSGINATESKIKLNNFTLSDGHKEEIFNKQVIYTFTQNTSTQGNNSTQGNTNTQENNNTQENTNAQENNRLQTNVGTQENGNIQENNNAQEGNNENSLTQVSQEQNSNNTNVEENSNTRSNIPLETNVESTANVEENIIVSTQQENRKIDTVSELKENDNTKAQSSIPQTGNTFVEIIAIIAFAIVGIIGFIKFKTIKLK